MVAYGTLTTLLRADLDTLQKDLERARALFKKYHADVAKMSVGFTASGAVRGGRAGGGGGAAAGGALDRQFRQIEAARQQAEREQRRFRATQAQAVKENADREIRQVRRIAIERQNDLRQQILLRRELERQDAAAAKEQVRRLKEQNQARIAEAKQRGALERELANQQLQREREFRRVEAARQQATTEREREARTVAIARAQAEREEQRRQLTAARQATARNEAVQRQALAQMRMQSGLGPVGGGRSAQQGGPTRFAGGAGSFITPQHLRGLDEANAKWLKQQQEIAKAGTLTERLGKRFDELSRRGLANSVQQVKSLASTLASLAGIGGVGAFGLLLKSGIDLNRLFETQRLGLAATLGLATKLVDARGQEADAQTSLNINLAEAAKLQEQVRREAAKTTLTARELFTAFSAAVGLGRSAGLDEQQTLEISKTVTQLGKSFGLRGEAQLAQEVRALLSGEGLEAATVGRVIGVTRKEQIEEAREAGKLFEFLTTRLAGARGAIQEFQKGYDGLIALLINRTETLRQKATEKLFERLKDRIGDLNQFLSDDRIAEWADRFAEASSKAFDAIERFFQSDSFKRAMDLFKFLVANSATLLKVFVGIKSLQAINVARQAIGGLGQTLAASGIAIGSGRTPGVASRAQGGLLAAARSGSAAGGSAAASAGVGAALTQVLSKAPQVATVVAAVLGSAAIGAAIGTLIRKLLSGEFGVDRDALERAQALQTETARRAPLGAMRVRAQERVREARREFLEASQRELQPSPLNVRAGETREAQAKRLRGETEGRKKALDDALTRQQNVETLISRSQAEAQAKRDREARQNLTREARQKIEAKTKEALFIQRMERELADDEIARIKEAADVRRVRIKEGVKDIGERNRLLTLSEEKAATDILRIQNDLRNKIRKLQAEAANDRKALLKIELDEAINNIMREIKAREDQLKAITALRTKFLRDQRDLESEEFLEGQSMRASLTEDPILQIINERNRALRDFNRYVERTVKDRGEQERRSAAAAVFLNQRQEEQIRKFRRDTVQDVRDLEKRFSDEQRRMAQSRLQFERDAMEAQKRRYKEIAQLAQEQVDLERDLKRAIVDRAQTAARLDRERTREGLRGRAEGLLQQFGISRQLEERFVGEEMRTAVSGGEAQQLGALRAQAQLRELAEQLLQPGGAAGVMETLRGFGITPDSRFAREAQGLQTGALGLGAQEFTAQREAEAEQQRREREDLERPVRDIQTRLQELQEQRDEAERAFNQTIRDMNERFQAEVRQSADDLAKLSREAQTLREALAKAQQTRDLGLGPLQNELIRVQRTATPQAAAATLGGSANIVFGPGSVVVNRDTTPEQVVSMLEDALVRLGRRAAPARR